MLKTTGNRADTRASTAAIERSNAGGGPISALQAAIDNSPRQTAQARFVSQMYEWKEGAEPVQGERQAWQDSPKITKSYFPRHLPIQLWDENDEQKLKEFKETIEGKEEDKKEALEIALEHAKEKNFGLAAGKAAFIRALIATQIRNGDESGAVALLKKYASSYDMNGLASVSQTLLTQALWKEAWQVAGALLNLPEINVKEPNESGQTPIMLVAIYPEHSDIFNLLRKKGADVNEALKSQTMADVYVKQLRNEFLPNIESQYLQTLKSVATARLATKLYPTQGTPPETLLANMQKLAGNIAELFNSSVTSIVKISNDTEKLLLQNTMDTFLRSSQFTDDEIDRIKFFAHLIQAKGALEGSLTVKLEGFTSSKAHIYYARSMMSAINKRKADSQSGHLLLLLRKILNSFERSVILDLINVLFSDAKIKMAAIEHFEQNLAAELQENQGILISTGYTSTNEGHAEYATTSESHVRVHNRGAGAMEHHQHTGAFENVFPYEESIGEKSALPKRLVELLKANVCTDTDAFALIYKQKQPESQELAKRYVPQPYQMVGNCTIANLQNAILTTLVDKFGEKEGMELFESISESMLKDTMSLLKDSKEYQTMMKKMQESFQEQLKGAILNKDQTEIVRVCQKGGKLTKELLGDKTICMRLAAMAMDNAPIFAALRDAGLPSKEDIELCFKFLGQKNADLLIGKLFPKQ